jgi:hypothetical protein
VEKEIYDIIARDGELVLGNALLSGYGYADLRADTPTGKHVSSLSFGKNTGHGHIKTN